MTQHNILTNQDTRHASLDTLRREMAHRPLVPFLGAGISVASGFPTVKQVNQYLAKVDFAITHGVYRHRYPTQWPNSLQRYKERPSQFLKHFGWPAYGQIDFDLWQWLTTKDPNREGSLARYQCYGDDLPTQGDIHLEDHLAYDFGVVNKHDGCVAEHLDLRDLLLAVVQHHLRLDLKRLESGADVAALRHWRQWKKWYRGELLNDRTSHLGDEPDLLYGNWESLLDHLCEGDFDLVDQLFTQLEIGRAPSATHKYLAFLKDKCSCPLMLTTNFDRLLERALQNEGVDHAVFDIHRDAQLPDPFIVRRHFSVLKLHGTSYGLRLGERLKYPLDAVSQHNILSLIPSNALVLVAGFSGYERRMLQLLRLIASRPDNAHEVRIVWLTRAKLRGWPKQLVDEYGSAVVPVLISDAATYLQELLFRHSKCFPAGRVPYLSSLGDPLYWRAPPSPIYDNACSSTESRAKALQKRRRAPVHIFISQPSVLPLGPQNDSSSTGKCSITSTEWATLSAASFAQACGYEYKSIYISLEGHHTVAGVVSEFFAQIRDVDPDAPLAPLNLHATSIGGRSLTSIETDPVLEKVISRMMDVFQRGKYVLHLDMLECFGRPQTMHHGIPSYEAFAREKYELHRKQLATSFAERVDFMVSFIKALADAATAQPTGGNPAGLGESYICFSIGGTPEYRHPHGGATHEPIDEGSTKAASLRLVELVERAIAQGPNAGSVAVYRQQSAEYPGFHDDAPSNVGVLTNEVSDHSSNDPTPCRDSILQVLEPGADARMKAVAALIAYVSRGVPSQNSEPPDHHAGAAFVALLSFFRRSRSLPLLYSVLGRWASGAGASGAQPQQDFEERVAQLSRWVSTPNAGGLTPPARLLEGGSLWLYREVRDPVYGTMTSNLSVTKWINAWEAGLTSLAPSIREVLSDGITSITWHWAMARSFYADVYRTTRDINAFYEYVYHRTSALRVITLLIGVCRSRVAHRNATETESTYADLLDDTELGLGYARAMGVFSPLGKEFPFRGGIQSFCRSLALLREEGITTLHRAFRRNRDVLRRTATPSTLLNWALQFMEREIHDLSGSILSEYTEQDVFPSIGITADEQLVALLKHSDHFVGMANLACDEEQSAEYFAYAKASRSLALLNEFFARIRTDSCLADMSFGSARSLASERFDRLARANGISSSDDELRDLTYSAFHDLMLAEVDASDDDGATSQREVNLTSTLKDVDEVSEKACDYKRSLHELRVRNCLALYPQWVAFDNFQRKTLLDLQNGDDRSDIFLPRAEEFAIEYEKVLRATATASDDDRRHRTSALTLRARTLYLRNSFRSAHRWLDLASGGLSASTESQKTSLAYTRICRSELLLHSAFFHWHRDLERISSLYKVEQVPSGLAKDQEYANTLSSVVQKVGRAQGELAIGEDLLLDSPHMPLWRISAAVGGVVCATEMLLYALEDEGLGGISEAAYSSESGRLEKFTIRAMRHVRSALDMLPLALVADSKDLGVRMEKFICGAWQRLFVAYLATSIRLTLRLEKKEGPSGEDVVARMSSHPAQDAIDQWRQLACATRFTKFAELAVRIGHRSQGELRKRARRTRSLIESIRIVSLVESGEEFCELAWNARRSALIDHSSDRNPQSQESPFAH